jgi:XTP/dITP diphosphohydrolase
MNKVVYVTGNRNKANHLTDLLGIDIDYMNVSVDEIQSMDVVEVARHKAVSAYKKVNRPVLVEDQAVYLNALGGFPGPFVKFMTESSGIESLARILDSYDDRSCLARDVFVYYDGNSVSVFAGEYGGVIAKEPRGENGWGWDPVYCPDGFNGMTAAELNKGDYDSVYLRIKPIEKLREFLSGI